MSQRTVKVQIVSDTICPWCYVGKKRFEKAITMAPKDLQFQVEWLPFFLDPTLPKDGVSKQDHYYRKFGPSFEQMEKRMLQVGKDEGISFSYGGQVANTLNSHRLIDYAHRHGKQNEVVNELFRNYFEEEKNLGSVDTLVEAASKAGLDANAARQYLNSEEDVDSTKKKVKDIVREYNVTGVPYFIFNDSIALSGAQEPATFLKVFEKLSSQ
eukprot:TRINITY_DN2087_c0_g1_i1.p1 TRINITY_DN2087_c0_g1~~TRINITY_DN2087_c0_g1_i1.p1  ORF type:complete len:212 (-),score=57.70 TRINITY_DN2087_c0_g1_i1:59-694(-)